MGVIGPWPPSIWRNQALQYAKYRVLRRSALLPNAASRAQNRWQAFSESLVHDHRPICVITSAQAGFWKKGTAPPLLRQADFAHEFGVARIGAQGIECEQGPEAEQPVVVLLVCSVQPLEGMILVTQFGIKLRDCGGGNVSGPGFALREHRFDSL